MENNEILKIVWNINNDLYERLEVFESEYMIPTLEFISSGDVTLIKFLDFTLWYSEEDEREFCEDKDEYEDLDKYLYRKIKEIIKKLAPLIRYCKSMENM